MTDNHPTPPKPAEHKPAPKKATRPPAPKAAPRPAPRAPIPSYTVPQEAPKSKGFSAAAVGVTLAAGALIGKAIDGLIRRGR